MKVPDKAALLLIEIAGLLYGQYLMGTAAWFPIFSIISIPVSLPSSQYVKGNFLAFGCLIAIVATIYSIIDPDFEMLKFLFG